MAHKAGVAVIAVGAMSSYDDVNSILLAGRADLCALGRTHLFDPQWTLHAAVEQDYRGPGADWPQQFRAGSRKPPAARTDAVRPRLALVREPEAAELPDAPALDAGEGAGVGLGTVRNAARRLNGAVPGSGRGVVESGRSPRGR